MACVVSAGDSSGERSLLQGGDQECARIRGEDGSQR